ncbi:helix-turn-helix domain-containing protein [Streptomyces sp. M2CJ-2]|uniref:helix-turn-helix domain-containing protein n=1 Tax=Streptomyces sp. M2CJ-2 TaxID=2803948 RepID=UPI0034D44B20
MFQIRKVRTVARGRRKLTREREECFRLVQQGVSCAEAAKAVGVELRTGKRWRNGRKPAFVGVAVVRGCRVGSRLTSASAVPSADLSLPSFDPPDRALLIEDRARRLEGHRKCRVFTYRSSPGHPRIRQESPHFV